MDRLSDRFGSDPEWEDAGPDDWEDGADDEDEIIAELPPSMAGMGDRRLQMRAYTYWSRLLGDGTLPPIDQLDLKALPALATNSVLMLIDGDGQPPRIGHLGYALARECALPDMPADAMAQAAARSSPQSLLGRIVEHHRAVLANRGPVGFEAEYRNAQGAQVLGRGILLPFAQDGQTIDAILGVVNWKEELGADDASRLQRELAGQWLRPDDGDADSETRARSMASAPTGPWADGPFRDGDDPAA